MSDQKGGNDDELYSNNYSRIQQENQLRRNNVFRTETEKTSDCDREGHFFFLLFYFLSSLLTPLLFSKRNELSLCKCLWEIFIREELKIQKQEIIKSSGFLRRQERTGPKVQLEGGNDFEIVSLPPLTRERKDRCTGRYRLWGRQFLSDDYHLGSEDLWRVQV